MLLIFDFDNTLEDFSPAETAAENAIFSELGEKYLLDTVKLREVFDDLKRAYMNPRAVPHDYHRATWFGELFRVFHLNEPVDVYVRKYWDIVNSLVRVFPGTYEVLEQLHEQHTLCILSDSDGLRSIKLARIEQLGLTKYFDAIFTGDAVGHMKPHPRVFTQVLEHYSVAAEHAVMIGDNPQTDLRPAHDLGMRTVWLLQGVPVAKRSAHYEYVDVVAENIGEILAVVETASLRIV